MTIVRAKRGNIHTPVPNEVIWDSRLSYAAKGVYVFLLSYPEGFPVDVRYIERCSDNDLIENVLSALQELYAAGYIDQQD